ncbi:MAG TPA: L-lactate dehydrogenase [Anaerolineales bacterium]|nr:L-lactate dehydrogenase [Anaerolineales bacterium]
MLTNLHPIKVAIIGTGRVGASCAYALQMSGLASEIILINANRRRAEGEAMDINHGSQFTKPVRVWSGDYKNCRDADIVVLTAGTSQRPGDTRLDLLKNNASILQRMLAPALRYLEDTILIVAANPVDVLTYLTWQMTGLPSHQIIGSGTILDTARFRFLLGQHFRIDTHSVHAYIIGEHGDSQVPVWSLANIAGMRLDEYAHLNGDPLDVSQREKISENTRRAAYEIIHRKGATYYAIAAGLVRIIEAIVRDENSVLTVSGITNGVHGLNNLALSLPSVINRQGIAKTLDLPLSGEEDAGLKRSAQIIHDAIASLNLDELISVGRIPSTRLLVEQ